MGVLSLPLGGAGGKAGAPCPSPVLGSARRRRTQATRAGDARTPAARQATLRISLPLLSTEGAELAAPARPGAAAVSSGKSTRIRANTNKTEMKTLGFL